MIPHHVPTERINTLKGRYAKYVFNVFFFIVILAFVVLCFYGGKSTIRQRQRERGPSLYTYCFRHELIPEEALFVLPNEPSSTSRSVRMRLTLKALLSSPPFVYPLPFPLIFSFFSVFSLDRIWVHLLTWKSLVCTEGMCLRLAGHQSDRGKPLRLLSDEDAY